MNMEQHIVDSLRRIEEKTDTLAEKQAETAVGLAVVATKVEEMKAEAAKRDETIEKHDKQLDRMDGVVKTVCWVGTAGGLSGLGAGLKALLGIGAQ
jgi:uncharacterized protein (DUF2336 family)